MNKFFALLIAIFFISTSVMAQTAILPSGAGTSGDPYQINSVGNLYWISQNSSSWTNTYFVQTADLDLGSYTDWPVIGNTTTKFTGSYDGQNHTISNLTINKPSTAEVGLFGHIGDAATIKNLGLINVDIKGARGTGSLVGRVTGDYTTLIEYCYVDGGTVVGDGATGGLVGSNNSNVENPSNSDGHKPKISKCYANVDVVWSISGDGDKIGGLVGCNQKGITENSFAIGSVTVDNTGAISTVERVGGLAGCTYLRGEIINSFSASIVDAINISTKVGGLVGYAVESGTDDGTVTDSYWDTERSGEATSGGGETGYTTSDMQTIVFPTWDNGTIWSFTSGQYPQLYQTTDGSTILPVELIAFDAKVVNEKLFIMWKTASEVNNKHFEVQVSENGFDFETISITKGAGDSRAINTYELLADYNTDLKYIRLKQVDFDGGFDIYGPLDIRPNNSEGNVNAIVYPNPAESRLIIKLSESLNETTFISIYDLSGKEVLSEKLDFNETEFSIDISKLSSGIYFLKSINNTIINRKIVINK